MNDSDDTSKAAVPAWQQAQPAPAGQKAIEGKTSNEAPEQATLEQARKFLQDDDVRKSTRERKAEFLKTKGIAPEDIEKLLSENELESSPQSKTIQEGNQHPQPTTASSSLPAPPLEDRTPVITYPEFLVKPQRPPPLVTVNGFLNTLKAFGGLSAIVYGTSKYVLEPMVERLTDARIELHESTNANLAKLLEKLEETVSEIPEPKRPDGVTHAKSKDDDDSSSCDDPTELFHRDIGVQTSRPSSPVDYKGTTGGRNEPPPRPKPAERLAELVKSVRVVTDGYITEAQDYDETRIVLDDFSREMTKLAYPDYTFGYNSFGGYADNEPDDEIKKAKDNIRRVKGVLLSTKSFPTGSIR